jgi:hypothetical protein
MENLVFIFYLKFKNTYSNQKRKETILSFIANLKNSFIKENERFLVIPVFDQDTKVDCINLDNIKGDKLEIMQKINEAIYEINKLYVDELVPFKELKFQAEKLESGIMEFEFDKIRNKDEDSDVVYISTYASNIPCKLSTLSLKK